MLRYFAQELFSEFNNLIDCIWTFNHQIDDIKKEELEKLNAYFGDNEELKRKRWQFEGYKVDYFFPVALNYSFVVLVFIELENKLMRLCEILYEDRKPIVRARDLSGSGIERYMTYVERVAGLKRGDVQHWECIASLQKIRNCIVHTAGMVGKSRDSDVLRKLIASESYFEPVHQTKNQKRSSPSKPPGITISKNKNGKKLVVSMYYPFLVASYSRDFLLDVVRRLDGSAVDWYKV